MNVYNPVQKRKQSKQVITIWADNKGRLAQNQFDFSFGDRSASEHTGYPMCASGRILSLAIIGSLQTNAETLNAMFEVTVDGEPKYRFQYEFKQDIESKVLVLSNPIELKEGDVINIKTLKSVTNSQSCVISCLIDVNVL